MDHDLKSTNVLLRTRTWAVDLQHLRYAVAAADHGSFRRAAEAMRLQQSTLSRCIRQLEELIGVIVFERSSGGVRATQAGRNFLQTARSILEQMDALLTIMHSSGRGEAGRLAIGFYTSLSAGNLRVTLMDYTQQFPQIEVSMTESSRTRLVAALRNGAIDIAIVTGETPLDNGKAMPLWSERIVVALPESHRLIANDTIYWTDLKGETLLMSRHDPGPEIEDLLLAKLASPEERPKRVRHDVSRESIKSLVDAGFGVSLITEASIGAILAGVTYREVRDGTGPSRIGYSAHWRADNENPALAGFLKLLRERYPSPVI
jgi:DNA-binding transcriptional LysR family regulator